MDILTSIEESVDLEEFTPTAKAKDGDKVKRARLAEIHRELTQTVNCIDKKEDEVKRLWQEYGVLEVRLTSEVNTLLSELINDD